MAPKLDEALQALVGEQLSSVTFVMDYWQLAFDGHGLTVFTRTTVSGPDWRVENTDEQFRNRLCERIGRKVAAVAFHSGDYLAITFDDASIIKASMREQDYSGLEAFNFYPRSSKAPYAV